MLKHAVKRLLIVLPAVWLIASAVFLLSKSIPGSASEMQFEAAAQSANSRAKAAAYNRASRQMLHKTGQDLPLFYFHIGTAAQPDTLYKIYPETEREILKQFIFVYGNWPQIATYYQVSKQIQAASLSARANSEVKALLVEESKKLFQNSDPKQIKQTLRTLKILAAESSQNSFQKLVRSGEVNFNQVVETANPGLNYFPTVHWHGFENQYHRWFKNLLQGNLGFSSRDSREVSAILAEAFWITIWLALAAFILVAILAPEIGMVLNRKSSSAWRLWILNFIYGLESIPLFIVALFLLALSSGLGFLYDFPEEVSKLLVVLCLVLVNLPYLISQAFISIQTELSQNYALTARAKGLPDKLVLRKHVFKNSLLPVITSLSDFFPALLAGTVVLEVIFSVPGMGRLLINSVLARDYDVITAIVLLIGLIKMISHVIADLAYALTDPRIRR